MSPRGGARKGAGRPASEVKTEQVTFYLRRETIELLWNLYPLYERSAFVDGVLYKVLKKKAAATK